MSPGERSASLPRLGAQWLTEVLRRAGTLPRGRVEHLDVSAIGAGVGLMSEVVRAGVVWSSDTPPGLPETLVVKMPSQQERNRAMAAEYGLYEREIRFYRELTPVAGIETPAVLAAEFEPATGDMHLVMADLAPQAGGGNSESLSDADLLTLVRDLATFHAAWWGAAAPRPVPDWLPRLDGALWAGHATMFAAGWEAITKTPTDSCTHEFLEFGRQLVRVIPALQARLAADPVTVVHFDLRRSNVFLIDGGDEEPRRRLAAVDWQPLSVARGPYDLAYFMTQSIATPRRLALQAELLDQYLEALHRHGVRDYAATDLLEDYRLAAAYTTSYAVSTTLVDLVNDEGRRFAEEAIARSVAAVEDLDLGSLIRRIADSGSEGPAT